MSIQKGYPSKERDLSLATSDLHITAEPIRQKQHGMTVNVHQFVREVGTDAAEAGSTTTVINATGHAALAGDVIRFTSGALSGQEVKVRSVATNTITVAEVLGSAPADTDTFQILRHKYPVVDANGQLSVNVGAVDVDLDESTDSVQIFGNDGTTNRAIKTDVDGNLQVDVLSSALPTGAATEAKQDSAITELQQIEADVVAGNALLSTIDTDTSNISTKIDTIAGTVSGTSLQVDIVNAPTLTVQSTDLDIRDLSSVSDSVSAVQSGTWNINNISGTISLPTGAATEATLSSIDTNTTNIEAALSLDVHSFARLDYSSTNVTTASYVELIASTGALTRELEIFDSSGQTLYLALGAAASEVDKLLIIPGGNGKIKVNIPASTRISLKAVSGTADAGEIVVNLLG